MSLPYTYNIFSRNLISFKKDTTSFNIVCIKGTVSGVENYSLILRIQVCISQPLDFYVLLSSNTTIYRSNVFIDHWNFEVGNIIPAALAYDNESPLSISFKYLHAYTV